MGDLTETLNEHHFIGNGTKTHLLIGVIFISLEDICDEYNLIDYIIFLARFITLYKGTT